MKHKSYEQMFISKCPSKQRLLLLISQSNTNHVIYTLILELVNAPCSCLLN